MKNAKQSELFQIQQKILSYRLKENYDENEFDELYSLITIALFEYKIDINYIYEKITGQSYKRKYGQFFTPKYIADYMACLVIKGNEKCILDSSCGAGSLLISAKERSLKLDNKDVEIFGIELDPYLYNICKCILGNDGYHSDNIINGDALIVEKKYDADVIISNPPFGLNTNYGVSDIAFLNKNLSFLKEGGILATIVPDGLLGNDKYCKFRRQILKNYKIEKIISLPNNVFEPYTSVKSSILVLKKEKPIGDYKIEMLIVERNELHKLVQQEL